MNIFDRQDRTKMPFLVIFLYKIFWCLIQNLKQNIKNCEKFIFFFVYIKSKTKKFFYEKKSRSYQNKQLKKTHFLHKEYEEISKRADVHIDEKILIHDFSIFGCNGIDLAPIFPVSLFADGHKYKFGKAI